MKTKLINELFMELEQFRTVPTPMEAGLKGELEELRRTMEKYRTTPIYVLDPGSADGDRSASASAVTTAARVLEYARKAACKSAAVSQMRKSLGGLTPVGKDNKEFDIVNNAGTAAWLCEDKNGNQHSCSFTYNFQDPSNPCQITSAMFTSRIFDTLKEARVRRANELLENHAELSERGQVIAKEGWQTDGDILKRSLLWVDATNGVMSAYTFTVVFTDGSAEQEFYEVVVAHEYVEAP